MASQQLFHNPWGYVLFFDIPSENQYGFRNENKVEKPENGTRFYMQVGFEKPSVGALCNSGRRLMQTFGHETAEKVKDLLYQLDAAPSLADLSSLPPILRNQFSEDNPPLFTVGKAGKGQVLFQPYGYRKGQTLRDIDSIDVISVGGTI